MKKVFYVLFASAALSIVACKSGGNKTEAVDSTEVSNMANEAQNAVSADTSAMKADTSMADTTKKM
jgi:hypothetical protein